MTVIDDIGVAAAAANAATIRPTNAWIAILHLLLATHAKLTTGRGQARSGPFANAGHNDVSAMDCFCSTIGHALVVGVDDRSQPSFRSGDRRGPMK